MNRYGKRCVLYPRVSTEMQVDGYSLEGQKNMLTRFADREEMIVVDTYEDLQYSYLSYTVQESATEKLQLQAGTILTL